MDCNKFKEHLPDYLEADLRQELCREIEEHRKECPDCRFDLDTVKMTIVLYGHNTRIEVPLHASERLRAALAREYQRNPEIRPD